VFRGAAIGLMGMLLLAGCGGGGGSNSRDTQDSGSLRGATFRMTAVHVAGRSQPLVSHAPVLIAFTRGSPEVIGRAGCSLFFFNGTRITPTRIVLPYPVHPVPNNPPACSVERRRQDAWVKAFLASNPHWELSPPGWKLGDEGDVRLTLTSGATAVELARGSLPHLSPDPAKPGTGSTPSTSYSGE
jgi:hypothetical protein